MVAAGLLDEDDPCELIEGELIEMPPIGNEHAGASNWLASRLGRIYQDVGFVSAGNPIVVGENSRPQPDLAVIPGSPRDFLHRSPRGDELILCVEIAQSSLRRDHGRASLYARGGVPLYWIVDLDGRQIEVHEMPSAAGYRRVTYLGPEDEIAVPGTGESWRVAELLP